MNYKLLFITFSALFLLSACDKKEKASNGLELWNIDQLRLDLTEQGKNLDELCANKNLDKKTLLMCEDISKSEALKLKIASDENYEFFIDCAKAYSETMTSTSEKMKDVDPEGYKTLHFGDETALYRYIQLPLTTRVMAGCEYQAEVKYWKGLIKNGKKSDMEFCVEIMTSCSEEGDSPCPKDKDQFLKECKSKI